MLTNECSIKDSAAICYVTARNNSEHFIHKQEPWRLPSRQAEFDETDKLRFDAHNDDQTVTGNEGYFEG